MKQITGADLFVKALKEEKVDVLFAYPGGQAIDLFNALYGEKEIDVILPRHEQGLIHAADGYARSTGKVGVCLGQKHAFHSTQSLFNSMFITH